MTRLFEFSDLRFRTWSRMPGVEDTEQAHHAFGNGYGISVVRGPYSYGGPEGLYELAVLASGHICYDTPITDDVVGWLSEEDIVRLARQVQSLPQRENDDAALSVR